MSFPANPVLDQDRWDIELNSNLTAIKSGVTALRAQNPEAWLDASTHANGALTVMDSGQAISITETGADLFIEDGAIQYEPDENAGYMNVELSAPVTRAGCRFKFDGETAGNAAIGVLLCDGPYVINVDFAAHLVVGPTVTLYQVRTAPGTLTTIHTVYHRTALATDGTIYSVEIQRNGNEVTLLAPDGTTHTFSNAAIGGNISNWATWEPYQLDPETDAFPSIVEVWADSSTGTPRNSGHSLRAIAEAVAPYQRSIQVAQYAPGTAASLTVGTSPTEIASALRTTVRIPPSGRVLFECSLYLVSDAASTTLISAYSNAGLSATLFSEVVRVGAGNEYVYVTYLFNSLTPLAEMTIYLTAWRVGGTGTIVLDGPSGKKGLVKVTPL